MTTHTQVTLGAVLLAVAATIALTGALLLTVLVHQAPPPLPPTVHLLCEHPDHPGDVRWAWVGRTDGHRLLCALQDAPRRPRP